MMGVGGSMIFTEENGRWKVGCIPIDGMCMWTNKYFMKQGLSKDGITAKFANCECDRSSVPDLSLNIGLNLGKQILNSGCVSGSRSKHVQTSNLLEKWEKSFKISFVAYHKHHHWHARWLSLCRIYWFLHWMCQGGYLPCCELEMWTPDKLSGDIRTKLWQS